jgi:deoxyguanosine kinase
MLTNKSISIVGPIGIGKTTLASQINKCCNNPLILENVNNNRFIEDFYSNPGNFSFKMEIYMLYQRWCDHEKVHFTKGVQDGSFLCDKIFAEILLTNDKDYKTYIELYEKILNSLEKLDLLIYLEADENEILKRIKKRGRKIEKNISKTYIKKLINGYKNELNEISKKYKKTIKINWSKNYNTKEINEIINKINLNK